MQNKKSMELLKIRNQLIDFKKPKIMGIINLSSDSYFSKSIKENINDFICQIEKHLLEGADFIDIGALSSNPNSKKYSADEEINILKPFLFEIEKNFPELLFSIDTFNSKTATLALDHGASIINDISAFQFDNKLIDVLANYKPCYILMHNGNDFLNMHQKTEYNSIFSDSFYFFSEKLEILKNNGVYDVIIDPGFGFQKDLDQNYELFRNINEFTHFKRPLLIGISRKSMIYRFLKIDCDSALNGSTVLHTISILKGANILRVHDVAPAKEVIRLIEKLELLPDINNE